MEKLNAFLMLGDLAIILARRHFYAAVEKGLSDLLPHFLAYHFPENTEITSFLLLYNLMIRPDYMAQHIIRLLSEGNLDFAV